MLHQERVTIELEPCRATYLLFVHRVEDRRTNYLTGFADDAVDGNELGQAVSDYVLEYEDGRTATTPITRRFAIQQAHLGWGASPFAAVPAFKPPVFFTATEEQILGHVPQQLYGRGETRHSSPRDSYHEKLWIYALPNPQPEKVIQRIILIPKEERSVIYALSTTQLTEHPLRPGVRQKLGLVLPALPSTR